MIYIFSDNVRHRVTKTFTILHYTSLHFITFHYTSLHFTQLQVIIILVQQLKHKLEKYKIFHVLITKKKVIMTVQI
jgi:hypothetical protein